MSHIMNYEHFTSIYKFLSRLEGLINKRNSENLVITTSIFLAGLIF